ncbi:hypothetical protein [Gillisia limnaea]|uniref:Uncharacterized protein n=1 Tax=Gillisia limnaea (strain DSM 15749 / LMG 21470 / R-8282) TaxID=865937 RepID=H2BRH3_GILLR|nr:hypothetical protein [Gillisia limnaea]EHQ04492.1 hypothetical protein Gilli_0344 [Gillisia limnaea DSM 15749]
MDTPKQNFRYVEWKSSDEMHYSCLQWISELNFIKDEQIFFQDMLKEYTVPILESHLLEEAKTLIFKLTDSEKQVENLMKETTKHRNGLQVLVDGIDQPNQEKEYREEHRSLLKQVNNFSIQYQSLKKDIFNTVSRALKQQKQKKLLS